MLGIHLERGGNGPIGRTLGTPSSRLNILQGQTLPNIGNINLMDAGCKCALFYCFFYFHARASGYVAVRITHC